MSSIHIHTYMDNIRKSLIDGRVGVCVYMFLSIYLYIYTSMYIHIYFRQLIEQHAGDWVIAEWLSC
ncbi:hypothetical protein K504DRAFT_187358 [Pleomassaria siparia CBS 279.74]|uniref:Uncharacterized protein n=1 Tax=Pleomassaria siparia CBS 279.74 TaxID=1314801 RepID=A0A6G1JS53_9PLEO|nr:hypothetical protein K504DRAFT_187358 [Pleomassaria siparia CBS 279.74]